MTKLVEGKIPPHTECPFAKECEIKSMGKCWHKGVEHNVYFSCGAARGFDIVDRFTKQAGSNNEKMGK